MCCSFEREKSGTVTNAFPSILDNSKRKTNKIWVDEGNEFIINLLKKCSKKIT